MPHHLPLTEFLQAPGPIFDVRTSDEYLQGHLPNSQSIPLFSNQERAIIGTTYKKQSKNDAIALGIELITPKLDHLLNSILTHKTSHTRILCWRGGMRSGFFARLLELFGITTFTLQGGYKSYRRSVLRQLAHFNFPYLRVLTGLTGSQKTLILHALQNHGEQIIDLEGIALHRGSAFGGIGLPPQPSQEHFENMLAKTLEQIDPTKPVWIEDESKLIGKCHLPSALSQSLKKAPLFYIKKNLEERLQSLVSIYGSAPKNELKNCVDCIAKKLGSERCSEIKLLIDHEKIREAFEKLLAYYDKSYHHLIAQRNIAHTIALPPFYSVDEWAIACKNLLI